MVFKMKLAVGCDPNATALKQQMIAYVESLGHECADFGSDDPIYANTAIKVAEAVASGKYDRGILFCGTGMGIHIAASKCPHVHAAVCESVPAALRCVTANNCNVLAMGGFYVAPRTGMAMADAFLEHKLGDGYEDWEGFYEFHKLGYDELEHFDYEAYKANGFQLPNPGNAPLGPEPLGHAY